MKKASLFSCWYRVRSKVEICGILDRTLIRERFSMKSKLVHMLVSKIIHAVVEASSSVYVELGLLLWIQLFKLAC